ncbi:MAG: tetratricopeptide repeat protein [Gemmatimonadota bacterium]
MWKLAAVTVLAVLVASAGCRKKEAPPAGGGEPINLNALSEIDNYKEILRKDPNNLQAIINIANLYFDTRQDLLAIENYKKALAIAPGNVDVRTDLAVCYRRTGKTDQAIEELKKAISLNPRHAQSRYNLGVILIHDKNDPEGGIRAWEGLLENVPDYPYRDNLKAEIARMRAMIDSMRPKTK